MSQTLSETIVSTDMTDGEPHCSEIASAFSLLVDELADVEDFARVAGQGEMARVLGYLRARVATVAINLGAKREGGAR